MKTHYQHLTDRILRAAMKVTTCRYRVVALAIDRRGQIIDIARNTPRLSTRGYHAEERLIYRNPRSLAKILIARVGARGEFLAIDPCEHCRKLAEKRNIKIERYEV